MQSVRSKAGVGSSSRIPATRSPADRLAFRVEILKDVCFRVTPRDRDAGEMVRSIRGYRFLAGYRGHPPADIAAIEELLLRVSRLVEEVPEIFELDLNPVIALPPGRGCLILDSRIFLRGEQKET
jgi:acetate---CoA ligase (ADP-forming)